MPAGRRLGLDRHQDIAAAQFVRSHVEHMVSEQVAQDCPLRDEARPSLAHPPGGKNQRTERRKEGKKSRARRASGLSGNLGWTESRLWQGGGRHGYLEQ